MKKRHSYLLLAAICLLSGCTEPAATSDTGGQTAAPGSSLQEEVRPVKIDQASAEPAVQIEPAPASDAVADKGGVHLASKLAAPAESGRLPGRIAAGAPPQRIASEMLYPAPPPMHSESYDPIRESGFVAAANDSLSTFSIDVDTASYSNLRRFLQQGSLPPAGAVRIEEMINYFDYDYPQPDQGPFSLTLEGGPCPWQPQHLLVRIGLQAEDIDKKNLPPTNLVFLIDVSGSMSDPDKLPLLKRAMALLVDQLDGRDRVAIVSYAGSDRVVLPPTAGDDKRTLLAAIDTLESGGSTHASQGIVTAYQLARQSFMPGGNNRVILASDGDFNVGVTSRGDLEKLIERERQSGVYLTLLGFGEGNYRDDTMEILADRGNGNYAYIDSLLEAKKVLVKEMSGTMFALASDVKIQVEFNPAEVTAYRLIGYENRAMADEEFNDDRKDAGEIGVAHRVTALYEVVPAGVAAPVTVDPLKYRQLEHAPNPSGELLTVKVRYKPLQKKVSEKIERSLAAGDGRTQTASDDFRFAAAVAAFGMRLGASPHLNGYSCEQIIALARGARGEDREGWRAEFVRLVEMADMLEKGEPVR